MSLKRIVISLGDPNGIGPEIIIQVFSDRRMLEVATPVVVGSKSIFQFYAKALGASESLFNFVSDVRKIQSGKLNVFLKLDEGFTPEPGKASADAGKMALKSLEEARALLAEQRDSEPGILITAPIDKSTIQSPDFSFPGHTEYLAKHFGENGESLMILMTDNLKIALVSGHIPVSQIAGYLSTEKIVRKIDQLNTSLQQDFRVRKPRIAVLGLNPHAGDQGLLGSEEKEIISPAIERAQNGGILAYGPFAADGFFGAQRYQSFDAILAMYHDQGLAPFKALSFGNGVNYTAGLSIIRTSPDHGTAYDLAGTGNAHADSFRNALYVALDCAKNRLEYTQINADPLKRQKLPRK